MTSPFAALLMPPKHSPQTRCLPKCLFPGTYFKNTDLRSQNTHTRGSDLATTSATIPL